MILEEKEKKKERNNRGNYHRCSRIVEKEKEKISQNGGRGKKKKGERENVGVKFSWRDVPEFNAFVPHPRPGILVPSVKTESTLELAVHAVLIPVHHNWFGFLLRSHHLLVLLMWLVSLVPIFELENLWNHAYPRLTRDLKGRWTRNGKVSFRLENFFFCTCKTLFLDLETLFQHLVPIFLQLLQETLVELLLPPFGLVFDVGQSDVAQEPA